MIIGKKEIKMIVKAHRYFEENKDQMVVIKYGKSVDDDENRCVLEYTIVKNTSSEVGCYDLYRFGLIVLSFNIDWVEEYNKLI